MPERKQVRANIKPELLDKLETLQNLMALGSVSDAVNYLIASYVDHAITRQRNITDDLTH